MGARLFRVFIPVADYDAAVKYYSALLGDEGRMIHRGRHYFDAGSVIIAVIENGGSPISDHLYFAVPDIENYFDRASKLGGLEEDSVHGSPSGEIHVRPWGERSFYCRDPFGNGLCFVDETTLFTGSR
ncbi:MAG: VOC family protein [Acidobacteria bacterium]|nr:VOC family protein [Acidobacteriota bacterium]MCW5950379.1 VOC family protein [Pyrinomonadaceae bacterium]